MDLSFPYAWRFTEEKYNLLPITVLNRIEPLPIDASNKAWNIIFENKINHLTEICQENQLGWICIRVEHFNALTIREGITLLRSFELDNQITAIFFWNKSYAVKVSMEDFINYWDDFCYPSDDNNVIYINHNTILTFVEEVLTLFRR